MSGDKKKNRPPTINLGAFKSSPESPSPTRPSFYTEESTMITSLSDLERERVARGGMHRPSKTHSVVASPMGPPPTSPVEKNRLASTLKDLSSAATQEDLEELNSTDAFEQTNQISPEELQKLEEGGLFDVPELT